MRLYGLFSFMLMIPLAGAQTSGGAVSSEQATMVLDSSVQYQLPPELKNKIPSSSDQKLSAQFKKSYEVSGTQLKVNFADFEFQRTDGNGTVSKKADELIGKDFLIDCASGNVTMNGAVVSTDAKNVLLAECENQKRGSSIRDFLQALSQQTLVANSPVTFPSQKLVSIGQGPQITVLKLTAEENASVGTEPIKLACEAELSWQQPPMRKEPLKGELLLFPTAKRIEAKLKGITTTGVLLPDKTTIPAATTIAFDSTETF